MSSKQKNRKKKNNNRKHREKNKNKHNITHEVISYTLIIIIAVLLASHLNVVVSGSMEPSFYRGDIVAVQNTQTFYGVNELNPEKDIKIGDVVIYDAQWYPEPVIHRVISIEEQENGSKIYRIKGDNNQQADPLPVEPGQIKAKVLTIGDNLLVIPKIGYITIAFRGL